MNTDLIFGKKRGLDSNDEDEDGLLDLFDQLKPEEDKPSKRKVSYGQQNEDEQDGHWGAIMSAQTKQKTAKKVTLMVSDQDELEEKKEKNEQIQLLSEADQDIIQTTDKKKNGKKTKKRITRKSSSDSSFSAELQEEEKKQAKRKSKKIPKNYKSNSDESNEDWAPNEVIAIAQKTSKK